MTGIFEHLSMYDDGDRVALRKAAAVAAKRVRDSYGSFLGNAADSTEAQVRRELVASEIEAQIQAVAAEYGVDPDLIRESTWENLPRGEKGQWNAQGDESKDLDAELADAPSAVGQDTGDGTLSSFRVADFCTDCFKSKCECDAEKDKDDDGDDDLEEKKARTAAEPHGVTIKHQDIGKNTHPDFSKDRHRKTPPTTEGTGSPHPTVQQDVYDKPSWSADPFAQTDAVTKSESLPSNDGDAGFADGGVKGETGQWTGMEGQANPVTSAVPGENPAPTLHNPDRGCPNCGDPVPVYGPRDEFSSWGSDSLPGGVVNKCRTCNAPIDQPPTDMHPPIPQDQMYADATLADDGGPAAQWQSSVDVEKNPIAEFLPDIDSLIGEFEGE